MTLFDASGTAAGVATVGGGTPALSIPLGGTGVGTTTSSGTANLNMGSGAGTAAGTSTTLGGTALAMVVAGLILGAATVQGDAHPQAAGTASGAATVSGTAAVLAGIGETIPGTATTAGSVGLNQISTGQVSGTSIVSVDLTTPASGTAAGTSTVSQVTPTRFRDFSGYIFGKGTLVWSYPRPMVGKTVIASHVVVTTVEPAIRAVVAPPKCFRYHQGLQRGDLSIFISVRAGPLSPYKVTYTMFQLRPSGSRFQVGPAHRTPSSGSVGEYYATGRAGDAGQPGDWIIRWEYQRSFGGAFQTKEQEFRVLDAVLANDPKDSTVRIRKYGWN